VVPDREGVRKLEVVDDDYWPSVIGEFVNTIFDFDN